MKKFFIVLLCVAAVLVLLWGGFIYATRYKVTQIDAATSPGSA